MNGHLGGEVRTEIERVIVIVLHGVRLRCIPMTYHGQQVLTVGHLQRVCIIIPQVLLRRFQIRGCMALD